MTESPRDFAGQSPCRSAVTAGAASCDAQSIESILLPYVERPLRYLGNELNIVRKDLCAVRLRGVLCFPDVYDVGMSHYGLQILYHIVNSREGWALGRAFHPWPDAEAIMRREGIALRCLEYQLPLSTAAWVGFTAQYELQYANIVNMLDLAGISVWSAERRESDPLIVLGGPCMGNPEPLAGVADAVAIGDGEETIVALCEALERTSGAPRVERLRALAEISGFYVPSMHKIRQCGDFVIPQIEKPVRAAKVPVLSPDYYPTRPLVPLINVVHHRLAVEIMRGCTRACRFCSAGVYYRPVRERPVRDIMTDIRRGMETTGWRDIGLLSLSTADYSQLYALLRAAAGLTKNGPVDIALPSTRIDALSSVQFAQLCQISSPSSLTIAPEAGSQRLRNVINKGFTDQQILGAVTTLFEKNVQTLKLYFMIGLPTETRSDLDAIIALVNTIAGMAASSGRRIVNVSVSPFSPKPHTPFQWEGMDSMEVLEEKNRYLRDALRRRKNVRISCRDSGTTFLETVLARGDRRVGDLVVAAWRRGARLDGWTEHFDLQRWQDAAAELGMDLGIYTRLIADDQPLPWGGVFTGVSTDFLCRERDKALRGESTGDCRAAGCVLCGACETSRPGRCGLIADTAHEPAPAVATVRRPTARHFYRFVFCKSRSIRFLGHLDMTGVLHRAFRAAGLPIAYSQGYTPMPRMSFGPPLALGAAGEAEIFDAEMTAPLANDQWQRPNAWLPAGLCLTACRQLAAKPPSVSSVMTAGRYRFEPLAPLAISVSTLRERLAAILATSSFELTADKNGAAATKNIRPMIYEATAMEAAAPGHWCIEAVLSATGGRTCRPAEFLAALFPQFRPGDFLVTRIACLCGSEGAWKTLSED